MTHYSHGIQHLADQIGLDPQHVAHAVRFASRTFARLQTVTGMSEEQLRQFLASNQYVRTLIANLALRHADRRDDAQLLMDIYKAAVGTSAHRPVIRRGVGTLPEYHRHPHVQQAIHILTAANLPPIETDGNRELKPGFQVLPSDTHALPGWLYIAPDPDAPHRTGFAGGDAGYLAVMRWAGWGVVTEPMPLNLWAVCHPDYRNTPFPF